MNYASMQIQTTADSICTSLLPDEENVDHSWPVNSVRSEFITSTKRGLCTIMNVLKKI